MGGELGVFVCCALDYLVRLQVAGLEEVVAAGRVGSTRLGSLLVELEHIADCLDGRKIVAFEGVEDVDVPGVDALFVPAVLVRLHSILCLINALSFAVKPLDPYQVERVRQQLSLNLHVEFAVAHQTGRQIDLYKPGLEFTVNQYVEAEELEAICPVNAGLFELSENVVLSGQNTLNDHIINARPEEVHVDMDCF